MCLIAVTLEPPGLEPLSGLFHSYIHASLSGFPRAKGMKLNSLANGDGQTMRKNSRPLILAVPLAGVI